MILLVASLAVGAVAAMWLSGWPSALLGVPAAFGVLAGLMMVFIDPD